MADDVSWEVLDPETVGDLAEPDTWAAVRELIDVCRGVCLECAGACAGVDGMGACVERCLDAADICTAASSVMTRHRPDPVIAREVLEACVAVCRVAQRVCGEHDGEESCRLAADVTERCEKSIDDLITLVSERARNAV